MRYRGVDVAANSVPNAKPHYHDCEVAIAYILKGWQVIEFEGYGKFKMNAGDAWNQAGVKHKVLDYSPDLEVMEINMPGDFDTVNHPF